MKNLFRKYRRMSLEQKITLNTTVGLCLSAVLAGGKFIVGLFTDYNLCTIAIYTFAILFSKLECLLGVKSQKRPFKTRNLLIAVFLFIASFIYIGFNIRTLFLDRETKNYGLTYVGLLAFISFAELGFAIAGIFRTKSKGHYYRNIKIINFCIALIAILTTQTTILDFTATENTHAYNSYAGIGVGGVIAACAVYILIAPKISVIDREHNAFVLCDGAKDKLINMQDSEVEILLSKSRVYGGYIYRARIAGERVDGLIVRGESLWKRMNFILKTVCCILSELLIFAWLAGRFIFFLRTINIPRRLEIKMQLNGFKKV